MGVRVPPSAQVAGPARSDAERRYFATQIEPRLGPGVTYVGEVGGERKLSLLRNARALLMPVQWEEPFGMVVVEVLVTGAPVLAFDRGAMAEIVEDGRTGLICADDDAMVEAVARVEALDRGVCRAAVENRFSSRRMAAEHAALYADVIRNGPPSLSPSRVS